MDDVKYNYLKEIQTNKIKVKVFLSNGTMLTGKIINFCESCIILEKCLIYTDNIISIVPE